VITTAHHWFIACARLIQLIPPPFYLSIITFNNVTYLLKVGTVVTEEQLMLANGSETTFISRQWFSKHIPTAMDTHAIIQVARNGVFYSSLCKGVMRRTTEATTVQLEGSHHSDRT
jgi:hypothetical protein